MPKTVEKCSRPTYYGQSPNEGALLLIVFVLSALQRIALYQRIAVCVTIAVVVVVISSFLKQLSSEVTLLNE